VGASYPANKVSVLRTYLYTPSPGKTGESKPKAKKVQVPDVRGMPAEKARRTPLSKGFRVAMVSTMTTTNSKLVGRMAA